MASQHLVKVGTPVPGSGSAPLAHLCGMDTTTQHQTADRPSVGGGLDPVVTLSQLAAQLGVSVQTPSAVREGLAGRRGERLTDSRG